MPHARMCRIAHRSESCHTYSTICEDTWIECILKRTPRIFACVASRIEVNHVTNIQIYVRIHEKNAYWMHIEPKPLNLNPTNICEDTWKECIKNAKNAYWNAHHESLNVSCHTLQHTATHSDNKSLNASCHMRERVMSRIDMSHVTQIRRRVGHMSPQYCVFYRIHSGEHTPNLLMRHAPHCNTMHHTATHCTTQQQSTTHCNTLQHTATQCDKLQHTSAHFNHEFVNVSCLTATNCNILQQTATCWNTL